MGRQKSKGVEHGFIASLLSHEIMLNRKRRPPSLKFRRAGKERKRKTQRTTDRWDEAHSVLLNPTRRLRLECSDDLFQTIDHVEPGLVARRPIGYGF